MQINSNSFLDFAKNIASHDLDINHRNAVSRAYYAMFHCVHESLGPIPLYEGLGVHESIDVFLSNLPCDNEKKRKIRSIIYTLKSQKTMRVKADYKLGEKFEKTDSDQAIIVANKFFDNIKLIS